MELLQRASAFFFLEMGDFSCERSSACEASPMCVVLPYEWCYHSRIKSCTSWDEFPFISYLLRVIEHWPSYKRMVKDNNETHDRSMGWRWTAFSMRVGHSPRVPTGWFLSKHARDGTPPSPKFGCHVPSLARDILAMGGYCRNFRASFCARVELSRKHGTVLLLRIHLMHVCGVFLVIDSVENAGLLVRGMLAPKQRRHVPNDRVGIPTSFLFVACLLHARPRGGRGSLTTPS